MKFGVRQVVNLVLKAKTKQKIGRTTFLPGQPVLYIDTATTSTLEGAATTVYAQGGRGNTRLIAWEGEKTLTFTVTDALMSPMGMAVLTGAGLIHHDGCEEDKHNDETRDKHKMQQVHMTTQCLCGTDGKIDLSEAMGEDDVISKDAPLFVVVVEGDSLTGKFLECSVAAGDRGLEVKMDGDEMEQCTVFVDYYVKKSTCDIYEVQIDAENFAGSYYVEADTLFRDQATGKDLPANITLPNVKIQSNFTFTMASTGDPSTFDFVMDAFPGYTLFDRTKKVLCVIQIIDEDRSKAADPHTVMPNNGGKIINNFEDEAFVDSLNPADNG